MNYILDTNILILLAKSKSFSYFFREKYIQDSENRFSYTHISLGELSSITGLLVKINGENQNLQL